MLNYLASAKTSGGQQPSNTTNTAVNFDATGLIVFFSVALLIVVLVIVYIIFRKSKNDKNDVVQSSKVQIDSSIENLSPEEQELIRKHRNESLILTNEEKELIRQYREQSNNK